MFRNPELDTWISSLHKTAKEIMDHADKTQDQDMKGKLYDAARTVAFAINDLDVLKAKEVKQ